jgi:hypothetical protein
MNKKSLNLILLSFVFIISFAVLVSAAGLDNSPTNVIIKSITDFLGLGETWKEIIIGIVIIMILYAGISGILDLTSLFSSSKPWVSATISMGLGIIAALTGLVNRFAIFMLSFAATLGTAGVVIEIVIAIIIFIGMSFGSMWAAKWAAKRYAAQATVKAIKGGSEVSNAITELKKTFKSLAQGE